MNLEVQHVKKKYARKGKEILRDINFTATSGECIGIVGLNGCGKTTLLSALAGILRPDEGSFLIDGQNLFEKQEEIRRLIGYVPQNNPLMSDMSVRDNLRLWYTGASLDLQQALTEGVLHMLGVDGFLDKKVSQLSGGMKKRLSIGCAMSNNPKILIMDEPSASLDIDCKEQIANYIVSVKERGGIVVLATHEEGEIALCDRLYLMKEGRLESYHYTTIHELTETLKA